MTARRVAEADPAALRGGKARVSIKVKGDRPIDIRVKIDLRWRDRMAPAVAGQEGERLALELRY